MFCIHCGAQNPDAARFCNGCGKIAGSSAPGASIRWGSVAIAATLILLVLASAVHFLRRPSEDPNNEIGAASIPMAKRPALVPIARTLVPSRTSVVTGAFTIPAGGYLPHRVEVGSAGAQLNGNFQATGGNNDIEVYITNSDGLTNFQGNLAFRRWYESKRSTRDTFTVNLPAGIFYLIFSNRFSFITPKAVTADVTIETRELKVMLPTRSSSPLAHREFVIPAGGVMEFDVTDQMPETRASGVSVQFASDGEMWAEWPGVSKQWDGVGVFGYTIQGPVPNGKLVFHNVSYPSQVVKLNVEVYRQ